MGAAFLIPTLLSAAGTAAEYANSSQANSRQNSTLASGVGQQQGLRSQAAGDIAQTTNTIAKDNPAQLQDQATQQYIQNLRSNIGSAQQPGVESSLTTQAGANPRYAKAQSAANTAVQGYGSQLAQEKGATDAAVRMRQNEGLDMGSLATSLQGLNQNSQSDYYTNQIASKAAGTQNPWVQAASSFLGNYGNALSKNIGGSGAATMPSNAAYLAALTNNVTPGYSTGYNNGTAGSGWAPSPF